MDFIRFNVQEQEKEIQQQCLDYLSKVDWGAAKKLHQTIVDGNFSSVFGETAQLYFLVDTPALHTANTNHAPSTALSEANNVADSDTSAADTKADLQINGFGAIVEQDYLPLPKLSPWISSIWVDPDHRGEHLSGKIVAFLEDAIRMLGAPKAHILTQHKGLYERFGYTFIQEMPEPMHQHDYLYLKEL